MEFATSVTVARMLASPRNAGCWAIKSDATAPERAKMTSQIAHHALFSILDLVTMETSSRMQGGHLPILAGQVSHWSMLDCWLAAEVRLAGAAPSLGA